MDRTRNIIASVLTFTYYKLIRLLDWKWLRGVCVLAIFLACGITIYGLSEAPALYYNNYDDKFLGRLNGIWFIYRPCNYLYDYTPLHGPLLKWAELWKVDGLTEELSAYRKEYRCIVIDSDSF